MRKNSKENPYEAVIRWFGAGNKLDMLLDLGDAEYAATLQKVPGLEAIMSKYQADAQGLEKLFLMEFVLHGLAEFSLIGKTRLEKGLVFQDLIVTVLPATPVKGLVLLISYVVGLVGALLLVALAGRRAFSGARWLAEPESWFRRGLGWVFVLVGVLVLTGLDRDLQTWLIIHAPVRPWEWVS